MDAPPITIQSEDLPDAWNEMLPLFEDHYLEVAHNLDIPLDPDTRRYMLMHDAGLMRLVTVRRGEELIGYSLWIVQAAIHYMGSLQAMEDVIYIKPECRGGLGAKLIKFSDDMLRAEGVQVAYRHTKKQEARSERS